VKAKTKGQEEPKRTVERTKPFVVLAGEYIEGHSEFESDLEWLEGRLAVSATKMGDHVKGLKNLNLPVFKTRLKDSCCKMSAKEGWRLYYAVSNETMKVFMLFVFHKHEMDNPATKFLQQKLQKAFEEGV